MNNDSVSNERRVDTKVKRLTGRNGRRGKGRKGRKEVGEHGKVELRNQRLTA